MKKAKKTIKAVLIGAAAGAAKGAVSGAAEAGSNATGIGDAGTGEQNPSAETRKRQSKSSKKR